MKETILLRDSVNEESDRKFLQLVECRFMLIFEKIKEIREELDPPKMGTIDQSWREKLSGVDHTMVWAELHELEDEMNQDLKAMGARAVNMLIRD